MGCGGVYFKYLCAPLSSDAGCLLGSSRGRRCGCSGSDGAWLLGGAPSYSRGAQHPASGNGVFPLGGSEGADGTAVEFEANWLWGALALASGYLLLVISAVFLLFEVRYPEHGFMAAFTASVSLLYFAISWRFREGAALRASRVVRRVVTLGIAGAALVYLYLSPSNGYSPPVYSAAYGAVFLAWAVLVLRHARRQGGG